MTAIYPAIVIALTHNFDAWIVGSAANPENINPRDMDILVPYSQWGLAAHLIPKDAKINTFSGWKFTQDNVEIDVWPGELGWVMRQSKAKFAYHPSSGVRLSKL